MLRSAQGRDAHHATLLSVRAVAAVGGAGHPRDGFLDDLPHHDLAELADLRANVALVRDEAHDPVLAAGPNGVGLPSDVRVLHVAAVVVVVLRDVDCHVYA